MRFSSVLRMCLFLLLSAIIGGLTHPPRVFADPVSKAITISEETNKAARESQEKIDILDDETKRILQEYRALLRRTDYLAIYRGQLKRIIASQEEEKKSLMQQFQNIESVRREIMPLLELMIDALEQFVKLDTPFLTDERTNRIKRLRDVMGQSDITISERCRRVLDAFKIETDYGRTFEAYRDELCNGRTERTVDFLRIGRVALYYQTTDAQETGYWDHKTRNWVVLPHSYQRSVQLGIRIARKRSTPELLKLPIRAPEVAQ